MNKVFLMHSNSLQMNELIRAVSAQQSLLLSRDMHACGFRLYHGNLN